MESEVVSVVKGGTEKAATSTANRHTSKSANYKGWGRTNPFLRFGLPLISLTIFGAVGLAHLQQGRQVNVLLKWPPQFGVSRRCRRLIGNLFSFSNAS